MYGLSEHLLCVQATDYRVIPLMTAVNGYPEYDPNQTASGEEDEEEDSEDGEEEAEAAQEAGEEGDREEGGEEEVGVAPQEVFSAEETVVDVE